MNPRVGSWPDRTEPFRVVILTKFNDKTKRLELDIPPQDSVKGSYKLIEGTAKQYVEDICDGTLANKELSLAFGYCEIFCYQDDGSQVLLDDQLLEELDEWEDITKVITNYEARGYKNLSVIITRHIEARMLPTTLTDRTPPSFRICDWLFQELSKHAPKKLPQNMGIFIPYDKIQRLTTNVIIRRVMKDEHNIPDDKRDSLAEYAHSHAPSLFLILIRLRLPLKVLCEAREEGITDKNLPIQGNETIQAPWIKDPSDRMVWEVDLHKYQWDFYAACFQPTFARDAEHQDFDPRVVIPYTESMNAAGELSALYML